MTRFIVRRFIQSCLLLLGITFISFFLQHLAPGGPEAFSQSPRLPLAFRLQEKHDFGLDQPVPVQYVRWLWQALHLNFGRSLEDQRPVMDHILERAPNTLELSLAGLLFGLLGLPLGIAAALRRDSLFDHGLRIFTVLGSAIPAWWLGLVILIVSARTVGWFPLAGVYTPGHDGLLDRLHHLLLPGILDGLGGWLVFSRYMRSELLEVLQQDYVRTARAKGLRERVVVGRHALRNALIVIVTILGGSLAGLLSGAVLIENVFSWPGMGQLSINAAYQRDYPVLMGLVVIGSALVIIGNFLADIAYGFIDPRVKYD